MLTTFVVFVAETEVHCGIFSLLSLLNVVASQMMTKGKAKQAKKAEVTPVN